MKEKNCTLNDNCFKHDFEAYEGFKEVLKPLTYDRDTGRCKRDGLFDKTTFENNAFGKITMPTSVWGKVKVKDDSDNEYVVEAIPVLPPRYRLDGETDSITDAYRKLVLRRNRISKLLEERAPEIIIQNEIDILTDSVIELFHIISENYRRCGIDFINQELYEKLIELRFLVQA